MSHTIVPSEAGAQTSMDRTQMVRETGVERDATFGDARAIAHLLDVNTNAVWAIIKGMKYSTMADLGMAVHLAFQIRPVGGKTVQK